MKFKIKDIIFTDKTKDGKELVDRHGNNFYMLHLEVEEVGKDSIILANEFGKWIGKYYTTNNKEQELLEKIKVGEIYNIDYKQSGVHKNIVSVSDLEGNIIITY